MLRTIDKRAIKEGYFCNDGSYNISTLKPLDNLNIISSGKNMYIFSIYCLDTSEFFMSCPVIRIFLKELFSDFILYNDIMTLYFDKERNYNYVMEFINKLIYAYEAEREDCYVW